MSKTCTIHFENDKDSVLSTAVVRLVEVHAYADQIVIKQDGVTIAEHRRSFGRGDTVRPLGTMFLSSLANPVPCEMALLPRMGLANRDAKGPQALDHGACSASVIINILARSRDPAPSATLQIPEALRPTHERSPTAHVTTASR